MLSAGSTTAAQFSYRIYFKQTHKHLDIAGMYFSKYGGALNSERNRICKIIKSINWGYLSSVEQTLSIIKPDAVERNLIEEIKLFL